jgi:endonuclease/exonuclease/phosphatase family metal-dependent hydrolase
MGESVIKVNWPRRILGWVTIGYTLFLVALLSAIAFWGERNSVLNLGLFIPPYSWLLPLIPLVPLALFLHPALCWWHLLCVVVVLGPFMGFQWNWRDRPEQPDFVCVTNNIATNHGYSLVPFAQRVKADVIALQDARADGPQVIQAFPGWHSLAVDQFVLISRYPIIQSKLISMPRLWAEPVAARFELSFQKQTIAVYNVRLPTPRADFTLLKIWLGSMRRHPLGIGDVTWFERYAATLPKRIELTRELVELLKQETLPFIVLGDFNTPSGCYAHRLMANPFADCFAKAGFGYGRTFPGDSPYLLSFHEPWLRIDYVFAGKEWTPLYCRVEPRRRSEHRAIVAGLKLNMR